MRIQAYFNNCNCGSPVIVSDIQCLYTTYNYLYKELGLKITSNKNNYLKI